MRDQGEVTVGQRDGGPVAAIRRRVPSRHEMLLMLSVCVFPVYAWSILNILREIPAWVLRLSVGELIGVVSYAMAFALFESLVFLLVPLALSLILPVKLFRARFVAAGTMLVAITSAWAVLAHLNDRAIRLWGLKHFALWGLVYLASVGAGYFLVRRFARVAKVLDAVAERLVVLGVVYVALGVLGLAVVIARNL